MKKQLLAVMLLATIFATGCTIVSANRVFPKLSWYWSHDAREQRAERKAEKQWDASLPTNSPAR